VPKKRGAIGIESARQKIERDALAVFAQRFRIAQARQRVIIGNEIECFAFGLKCDSRLHHAKIIADVQNTAGLYSG
jgi:hypothetical protein